MKKLLFFLFCSVFPGCKNQFKSPDPHAVLNAERANIYNFKLNTLAGTAFDFSTLKGKKIMIVNTASKCGLTPQYKLLQELYTKYKDKNFIIIGFPANDFMKQEPGNSKEIASFCEINYGVTFPMMEKIEVTGVNKHPIYQFLTQKLKNGISDNEVSWNFQKYLINEKGQLEQVVAPRTSPNEASIIAWIEK
ncbi:MAG: glutathione peroxidase [Flavobacterium sp.]